MSKQQAADELGVNVVTLDNWRWTGRGPAYVKLPKEVRYHPDALRKFITDNTHQQVVQAHMESRQKQSMPKRGRKESIRVSRVRDEVVESVNKKSKASNPDALSVVATGPA